MDPRLLRLYSDELGHLREVGAEFAREFPKIAARLGMDGMEVTDPYVERLLEGFAFLAARVQLKLEAEHPRLIAAPARIDVPELPGAGAVDADRASRRRPGRPEPRQGPVVPRGSALRSELPRGQDTRCEFRTAHAVTLWPIELASVQYFSHAPDLPRRSCRSCSARAAACASGCAAAAASSSTSSGSTACRSTSPRPTTSRSACTSWCSARRAARWCAATRAQRRRRRRAAMARQRQRARGRLRRRRSAAAGIAARVLRLPAAAGSRGDAAALALLRDHRPRRAARPRRERRGRARRAVCSAATPALEALVDRDSLALFCTPAINLFPKRLDRIQLGTGVWEYHVVPDRTRPMDYEVHSIASVTGFGTGRVAPAGVLAAVRDLPRRSRPPRTRRTATTRCGASRACCRRGSSSRARARPTSARRSSCRWSTRATRRTAKTSASCRSPRWVTNRDLPTLLPPAASGDDGTSGGSTRRAGGAASTSCAARRGRSPGARSGELGWSLVSQLTLNHLALVDESPATRRRGAAHHARRSTRRPRTRLGAPGRGRAVRCEAQPSCGGCRSTGR